MTAREDLAEARAAWAADPAPVAPLQKQDTSPRILTHAIYGERFPTRREKRLAVADLPYLRHPSFVELRSDLGQDFLYVRRKNLYLGGYFGTRCTSLARSGLTFLWHPVAGMVVHSLNNNDQGCWGTVPSGRVPDANGDLPAAYFDGAPGGRAWTDRHSRSAGTFGIRYQTPDASVRTDVTVERDTVRREVRAASAATEQIPLIVHPDDVLTFTDGTRAAYGADTTATAGGLDLRRGRTVIKIRWGAARPATLKHGASTYLRDAKRLIHVLRVPYEGTIDVTITLT